MRGFVSDEDLVEVLVAQGLGGRPVGVRHEGSRGVLESAAGVRPGRRSVRDVPVLPEELRRLSSGRNRTRMKAHRHTPPALERARPDTQLVRIAC